MRDTQKGRLYAAERMLVEMTAHDLVPGRSMRETTVADVQAFVDRVLARKRVRKRYPRCTRIGVVRNGSAGGSRGGYGVIHMSLHHQNRLIVLHEVAHCLAGVHARHGWYYAATYLFLVREVMGVDVARRLQAAYKAKRVRYRKPRKGRVLTPDERAALVARLTRAREIQRTRRLAACASAQGYASQGREWGPTQ